MTVTFSDHLQRLWSKFTKIIIFIIDKMGRKIRPWKSIGKQPQDGLSVAMMEYITKWAMYIKNSVKRSQYGILEIRKISVHIIHQSNFEARTNNAPKMVVHNDMDVSILSSRIAVDKIPNQEFFLSISSISVYFSKKHTCTSATVSIPKRPEIRTTKGWPTTMVQPSKTRFRRTTIEGVFTNLEPFFSCLTLGLQAMMKLYALIYYMKQI